MATRRLVPAMVRATAASMLAVAVAWCTPPVSAPAATAVASPVGPLLSMETRGGLCADGPCGTTIVIERDGRVHRAAKPSNDLGTVPPDVLAALDAAIRTADFAAISRRPFTGQCPTAVDGQELVFAFGTLAGVERIATCEVEVDFGSPLFRAAAAAAEPFIALPASGASRAGQPGSPPPSAALRIAQVSRCVASASS